MTETQIVELLNRIQDKGMATLMIRHCVNCEQDGTCRGCDIYDIYGLDYKRIVENMKLQ